ncbi:alpha-hydroxy acid oxidase [Tardiphaga sp. OK245]|uniref:alpha-hydroxy acid oxidase n=1 Tax=Tardiphaga sp. OK245 TaxID=1855306 RepID=UPI0008A75FBD|nr:alpha-hydroxy acid oxidase [Tardiphaga sp. OK245]SEH88233.1 L-lactate dehydrogenase (cytochrome) [Tardiphaga sp. OK245]
MTRPITSIDDLRALVERRVPRMFYQFCESGSWTESTFRANQNDLTAIRLRQRVARDITDRSLETTMIGEKVSMPVAIAPTGLAGMLYADGEILGAKAAAKAHIPFTLPTMSICSIEDVAAHSAVPFWFQLYVMRDKTYVRSLIGRAKAAGCSALIVTLDLQVVGQRHKDIINGLSAPPRLTLPSLVSMATKPRWCLHMLQTRRRNFGNIIGHVKGVDDIQSIPAWIAEQFDPALSWDDIKWIRDQWAGKLILKGILDPEDAELATQTGADAVIVSNHGGRQLDGALSAISALPDVARTVGARMEVFLDGGIRSGQDVIKAVASGAKAVFIGRSWLYGLGADGERGVTTALNIIRKELDLTMAFCGLRHIEDVDQRILAAPHLHQRSDMRILAMIT